MQKKLQINIIVASLITLILLVSFTVGYNIAYIFASEDERIDFNTTSVLEDLQSAQGFNILDYPYDSKGELKIVNFVEYCYSVNPDLQGDYGLYIYVYNPRGLGIDTESALNKIQIAVSYNAQHLPNDYEKFSLTLCSRSEGDYSNLFYKFRIVDHASAADGKTIQQRANSNLRRYDVSGIELRTTGAANATEYPVAATYKFQGYAKGYGPDASAESTLASDVNELETVMLDVDHTYYRYANSISQQEQVNSVYFSVNNSFLDRYGKLKKIKAEWWEYRTQPIIIMSKQEVYNALLPWVGVDIGGKNDDIGWILGIDYEGYRHWGYNLWNSAETNLNRLTLLFYTNGIAPNKFILDSEELKSYIYDYDKSAAAGYLPVKDGNEISADLFESSVDEGRTKGYNLVNIDADETFDLLAFDRNFWNWWVDFFYDLEDEDINGITPIYEVKPADIVGTDAEISKRLFIAQNDVSDFKAYCYKEFNAGKTPFLFRFAITDYFVEDIAVWEDKLVTYQHWDWAYKAQETVFFDFDIIQLTFSGDGQYYVIPVVSSPLDIIPDITPPPYKPGNDGINWLMIVFLIIVAILVVAIIKEVVR